MTFDEKRPFSWSQISSFRYDPEQWYQKYVLKQEDPTSAEMEFGKTFGEKLASDPKFMPDVPRYAIYEHPLVAQLDGIPLVGYIDSYNPAIPALLEYKTGKRAWTQERVDDHGQLTMYALMLHLAERVRPADLRMQLVWIPTMQNGDFSISLTGEKPQPFTTSRTMRQLLEFGQFIKTTREEMRAFAKNHA